MSDRRPEPANLEVEQALLGAILINNDAYHAVSGFLLPKHFLEPLHRELFKVMGVAIGSGRKANPTTLISAIPPGTKAGSNGAAVDAGKYVAALAAGATTILNAPDYGRIIFELHLEREMIGIADEMVKGTGHGYGGRDVSEQLAAAEGRLAEIRRVLRTREDTNAPIGEAAEALVAAAEEVRKGTVVVPSTGLLDVDKQLAGGLRPRRLMVFGGRPGMGKTVLLTELARRVAKRGYGVGVFSLEVDKPEIAARIVASALSEQNMPMDYRDLLTGHLNEGGLSTLRQGAFEVADLPIEIDDASDLTITEIEGRAKLMQDRFARRGIPMALAAIDYLGLVTPSERYRGRRVDELGEIAKGGKEMAKRLGLTVVAMAQLSRDVEKRDDKRPQLSDLRDSGNIEEHADVVGFLFREAYYLQNDPDVLAGKDDALGRLMTLRNQLELIIPKNRLGPVGIVRLFCDVAKNSIDNLSQQGSF